MKPRRHSNPAKNNKKLILILISVIVLVAVFTLCYIFFKPKPTTEENMYEKAEYADQYRQDFEYAMELMESKDAKQLQQGLKMLEDLGKDDYLPALYELAFTYGMFSDSASVARKDILGIKRMKPNAKSAAQQYIPQDTAYINLSLDYLDRIINVNDDNFPEIKAKACYRIAMYYNMDLIRNISKGEKTQKFISYLREARDWTDICDSEEMQSLKIDINTLLNDENLRNLR